MAQRRASMLGGLPESRDRLGRRGQDAAVRGGRRQAAAVIAVADPIKATTPGRSRRCTRWG